MVPGRMDRGKGHVSCEDGQWWRAWFLGGWIVVDGVVPGRIDNGVACGYWEDGQG